MVSAIEGISFSSLICKTEPEDGAKSWIFGAPMTTGTEPSLFQIRSKTESEPSTKYLDRENKWLRA